MAKQTRQVEPNPQDAVTPLITTSTFSEGPARVITVDAIIANGSHTPTGTSDHFPLTFSTIQFGAASVDTNSNLQFQDVVIDDPPLLVLTLSVATAPATITIYGAWDYSSTQFTITTVNLPTTAPVTITNIPIPPPAFPPGQGDILQLFLSSSTTSPVTWSAGHVYGVETVPVWPPVEGSPIPPSVAGQPLIFNSAFFTVVQAVLTNTTATTAGTVTHIPVNNIFSGTGATVNANNDLVFNVAGTYDLHILGNVKQASITTPSNNVASVVYNINGGPNIPIVVANNVYANTQYNFDENDLITVKSGDILQLGLLTNVSTPTVLSSAQIGVATPSGSFFSATPLVPPPLISMGGGAPPTFPPPTPPPIGAIPAGVLVGPAIAAAGVPPSIAGKALIIFTFGSATTPPASAAFPEFTTTFPSPPIVFSNIYTGGATPTTPPSTASTPPMGISYNTGGQWGPPIGPALPPVVPVSRPFMVATNGDPDDVVYAVPVSEPDPNGEVYDDSDEENEDWVEETPHRTPDPPKPRRGRRRR